MFKQEVCPKSYKDSPRGLTSSTVYVHLGVKARLHRLFLSQQLDAILVALKLQLQNRMCKPGAICRRDIARGFEHV